MSLFDPEKIYKVYALPCIKVRKESCNIVQNIFRESGLLFKLPNVSPILSYSDSQEIRVLLLREELKNSLRDSKKIKLDGNKCGGSGKESLEEADYHETRKDVSYVIYLDEDWFIRLPESVFHKLNDVEYAEFGIFNFEVKYKYLSYTECIRQCIPDDIEIVSSFETVGHIAHLNLNEDLFPYRNLVGEILLSKNPGIKTVVVKTGNIVNVFRTYPLEIVAGEHNLTAKIKEQGITYNVEIDRVYWNSRLSCERQRIVQLIPKKSNVFDLTCGVGAFTIPLVKLNECLVYSNDLNPDSIRLLWENIEFNKLNKSNVSSSQKDCLECIHYLLESKLDMIKLFNITNCQIQNNNVYYWICNLPELSINILSGFRSFYEKHKINLLHSFKYKETTNYFYFYCFSKDQNDPKKEIQNRIHRSLKVSTECNLNGEQSLLEPRNITIHQVRDVSPNKKMYCAQFTMTLFFDS